jgi:hypothetical protein
VKDGAAGANTGNLYRCSVAHTSAVWATDLASPKWVLMIDYAAAYAAQLAAEAAQAAAATATTAAATATKSTDEESGWDAVFYGYSRPSTNIYINDASGNYWRRFYSSSIY